MFRRVSRLILLSALSMFLLLGAGAVFGQNADKNSAGPTRNDFRLQVIEPLEGATVTGSTVRVTVANGMARTLQGGSRTNDMPNPSFRVYLGDTLKGELKRDENVLTIENVPAGNQKLVVEAVNSSGEVVDRKQVNFQTAAATSSAPLSADPTINQKPAASSAPTNRMTSGAPPVNEAAPAPTVATGSEAKTLPQTGSSVPRAGLTGLGLVLAGLLLSRKTAR